MIETWKTIHYGLATLSVKKIIAIGTVIGFGAGEFVQELLSGKWGAAGVWGAVAITGLLMFPKAMEQRRRTKMVDHNIAEDSTDKTISRIVNFYQLQVSDLTTRLSYREQVAAEYAFIANLERDAKHAMQTQLQCAELTLRELIIQLRSCSACGKLPEVDYKPKSYQEICKDFDDQIRSAKKRVAEISKTI